ncbi:diguanylate cyclase domain-containing protein [Acinetobacter baumannii]|uniref:diguanylate cyclase domain-containing protein n=1 Tax=Acinetobacter baumannii TaxID=470 RepID=UPI003DA6DB40
MDNSYRYCIGFFACLLYGHGCGDEVLKHFAARLREHIRATDMAARIGGGGGIRCVVGSGID